MSISKPEMRKLMDELKANSNRLLNDAIVLSDNGSHGSGMSLLIQSMEESMKYSILMMDYNGFKFRQKVDGIKSLFSNHDMRYGLGMVLTIFYVLGKDLTLAIGKFHDNPKETLERFKDKEYREAFIMGYLKKKIIELQEECIWYSKAEYLRQSGFYVDYKGGLKSPLHIDQNDFGQVLVRVKNVREVLNAFDLAFIEHAKSPEKHIIEIQDSFQKEGFYSLLGDVAKMFGKGKPNPLLFLSGNLDRMLSDIESGKLEEE